VIETNTNSIFRAYPGQGIFTLPQKSRSKITEENREDMGLSRKLTEAKKPQHKSLFKYPGQAIDGQRVTIEAR
jgi:hypothetical protein